MATWTTRDKRLLDISEMSDKHVNNTIRFLDRKMATCTTTYDALCAERAARQQRGAWTCADPEHDEASVRDLGRYLARIVEE